MELLCPPSSRHVTCIFMGRSHECLPPHARKADSEERHDHISAGMHLWFADAQSAADALLAHGVVDAVPETLLHEWSSVAGAAVIGSSRSLVETVLRTANAGTFSDTTTLVLHWVWDFSDCCLPLRSVSASSPQVQTQARGPRAAWPTGHRPYFDDNAGSITHSMPSFLWELSSCMPQLTRLHLVGGGWGGVAGACHCKPSDTARMQQWRAKMNTRCIFTAAPWSVPQHWVSPRRPAPLRWLGDNGDTAGAGTDTGASAGAEPMHPHPTSQGVCRDTTHVDAGEVAGLPGADSALSSAALHACLASTNGLWRELLTTAYLPPAPPRGLLGFRLLELHLDGMRLSSRDVASLPLLFPHLRFLRLYYCRGYSRLAMEATAEHFSSCSLCLLGGGSMYRTGAQHKLEAWREARGWMDFLPRTGAPVHSTVVGPMRRRLIPRAITPMGGCWLRRGAAVLCRAGRKRRPTVRRTTATKAPPPNRRRVSGPVILALAALRLEADHAASPGASSSEVAGYAPLGGGSAGAGEAAKGAGGEAHVWWWRGSQMETQVLQGGARVLQCCQSAPGGGAAARKGGAAVPNAQQRDSLLQLAVHCKLACSPLRAEALLAAAARVPGASLLGYSLLDHDRDELSGSYWPVGGDWHKGGMGFPQQEPSAEAGWTHFWEDTM